MGVISDNLRNVKCWLPNLNLAYRHGDKQAIPEADLSFLFNVSLSGSSVSLPLLWRDLMVPGADLNVSFWDAFCYVRYIPSLLTVLRPDETLKLSRVVSKVQWLCSEPNFITPNGNRTSMKPQWWECLFLHSSEMVRNQILSTVWRN